MFFFVLMLTSLVKYRSHINLLLSRDCASVQNRMFSKNSLWIYWLQNSFFRKKVNFYFCQFLRSSCRRNTNSEQLQVSRAFFGRINVLFLFQLAANGFHDFEKNRFRKIHKFYLILHSFTFFVFLWPILIKERSHTTTNFWPPRKTRFNIFWGQNMDLRRWERFLAIFNWIFVCCLFLVFFVTAN